MSEHALAAIAEALASTEFRCPGEHRLDGVHGDAYDYMDEMMDEMDYPVEWDAERLAVEHPEEYKTLRARQDANWVERGKCQQVITIEMEYDGDEYATFCYPVARGECVTALGLDEDFEYDRPLWQVASERRRLARLLRDAMAAPPALEAVS